MGQKNGRLIVMPNDKDTIAKQIAIIIKDENPLTEYVFMSYRSTEKGHEVIMNYDLRQGGDKLIESFVNQAMSSDNPGQVMELCKALHEITGISIDIINERLSAKSKQN